MAQLWFRFWAKDYIGDGKIGCLTYEKRGILQTLWAYAWEEGSIPADQAVLGELLKLSPKAMRTHYEWILHFFHPMPSDPSRLISPRLEEERLLADEKGAKARESALQRWSKRNANALPTECADDASQSQSQIKSTPQPPSGAEARLTRDPEIEEGVARVMLFWEKVAVPGGLPGVVKLDAKRRKPMEARLKEVGWFDLFREAVTFASQHPDAAWMRGLGDRKWKASMDWFLKPGNVISTVERARAAPARVTPLRPSSPSQPSSFPKIQRVGP